TTPYFAKVFSALVYADSVAWTRNSIRESLRLTDEFCKLHVGSDPLGAILQQAAALSFTSVSSLGCRPDNCIAWANRQCVSRGRSVAIPRAICGAYPEITPIGRWRLASDMSAPIGLGAHEYF